MLSSEVHGAKTHVDDALTCTDQMLGYLNSLSFVLKLEEGFELKPSEQKVDLLAVLGNAAKVVKPQLREGVELRVELPQRALPPVMLDRVMLSQILINLLQNAARFTAAGFVRLRCAVLEGDVSEALALNVHFAVDDTGPGIDEETQKKLFTKYASSTLGSGGVGVGLYLSHRLVRLLGGELEVLSPGDDGPGTSFRFDLRVETALPAALPAANTTAAAAAARWSAGSSSSAELAVASADELPVGLRVLICDDMKISRMMLSEVILKRLGAKEWSVEECQTAEEALAKLIEGGVRYDVIFMDENFGEDDSFQPRMLGTEAIRRLRAFGLRHPVVVAMSGNNDAESVALFERCGADDCWGKPFPDWRDGTFQRGLAALCERRAEEQGAASPFRIRIKVS